MLVSLPLLCACAALAQPATPQHSFEQWYDALPDRGSSAVLAVYEDLSRAHGAPDVPRALYGYDAETGAWLIVNTQDAWLHDADGRTYKRAKSDDVLTLLEDKEQEHYRRVSPEAVTRAFPDLFLTLARRNSAYVTEFAESADGGCTVTLSIPGGLLDYYEGWLDPYVPENSTVTLKADAGGTLLELKRQGGFAWKFESKPAQGVNVSTVVFPYDQIKLVETREASPELFTRAGLESLIREEGSLTRGVTIGVRNESGELISNKMSDRVPRAESSGSAYKALVAGGTVVIIIGLIALWKTRRSA